MVLFVQTRWSATRSSAWPTGRCVKHRVSPRLCDHKYGNAGPRDRLLQEKGKCQRRPGACRFMAFGMPDTVTNRMNTSIESGTRAAAASVANRDDAELWRWFCLMYEDGRIRWCATSYGWLVSVDHKHLATETDFDTAIRSARQRFESGRRCAPGRRRSATATPVVISIGVGRVKPRT